MRWILVEAGQRAAVRPGARSSRTGHVAGACREKAIAQCGPNAGGNRGGIGIGIDQNASLRLARGNLPVGVAQFLMKPEIFRLEPVGLTAAASRSRALPAD